MSEAIAESSVIELAPITCSLESWSQYLNDPDRAILWREHYEELSPAHEFRMVQGPDLSVYAALDAAGALQITVARRAGRMIGYCLVVIRRHIHYTALCAFEDAYFVSAPERRGLVGYRLLHKAIGFARARGAVRAYFMTKEFASIERLLTRMGMVKSDSVFTLWL